MALSDRFKQFIRDSVKDPRFNQSQVPSAEAYRDNLKKGVFETAREEKLKRRKEEIDNNAGPGGFNQFIADQKKEAADFGELARDTAEFFDPTQDVSFRPMFGKEDETVTRKGGQFFGNIEPFTARVTEAISSFIPRIGVEIASNIDQNTPQGQGSYDPGFDATRLGYDNPKMDTLYTGQMKDALRYDEQSPETPRWNTLRAFGRNTGYFIFNAADFGGITSSLARGALRSNNPAVRSAMERLGVENVSNADEFRGAIDDTVERIRNADVSPIDKEVESIQFFRDLDELKRSDLFSDVNVVEETGESAGTFPAAEDENIFQRFLRRSAFEGLSDPTRSRRRLGEFDNTRVFDSSVNEGYGGALGTGAEPMPGRTSPGTSQASEGVTSENFVTEEVVGGQALQQGARGAGIRQMAREAFDSIGLGDTPESITPGREDITVAPDAMSETQTGLDLQPFEGSRDVFHGTSADVAPEITESGFVPGSQLPEDAFRSGGYGDMLDGVSMTTSPRMATNFTGTASEGAVIRSRISDDANVVSVEGIEDSSELNEYIPQLREEGVDAVSIGGGEDEIVVLNPDALEVIDSRTFRVANNQARKDVVNYFEQRTIRDEQTQSRSMSQAGVLDETAQGNTVTAYRGRPGSEMRGTSEEFITPGRFPSDVELSNTPGRLYSVSPDDSRALGGAITDSREFDLTNFVAEDDSQLSRMLVANMIGRAPKIDGIIADRLGIPDPDESQIAQGIDDMTDEIMEVQNPQEQLRDLYDRVYHDSISGFHPRVAAEYFTRSATSNGIDGLRATDEAGNQRLAVYNDELLEGQSLVPDDLTKAERLEVALAPVEQTTKVVKNVVEEFGLDTVNRQQILNVLNKTAKDSGVKKPERFAIEEALKEFDTDQIPVGEFIEQVDARLLPIKAGRIQELGVGEQPRWESVRLNRGERGVVDSYDEFIYESPIQTRAGSHHWGDITGNYFMHSRVEYMADGKTVRVNELQSDLFQQNRFERPIKNFVRDNRDVTYDDIEKMQKYLEGSNEAGLFVDANAMVQIIEDLALGTPLRDTITFTEQGLHKYSDEVIDEFESFLSKFADEQLVTSASNRRWQQLDELVHAVMDNKQASNYKNIWHEVGIRHELHRYRDEGKRRVLFPGRNTIANIEGFDQATPAVQEFIHELQNGMGFAHMKSTLPETAFDDWDEIFFLNMGSGPSDTLITDIENVTTSFKKEDFRYDFPLLGRQAEDFANDYFDLGYDSGVHGLKPNEGDLEGPMTTIRREIGDLNDVELRRFVNAFAKDQNEVVYWDDDMKRVAFLDYDDQVKTVDDLIRYYEEADFDIAAEFIDHPTVKFYTDDVADYLKKNYDAKEITDENGWNWYEVDTANVRPGPPGVFGDEFFRGVDEPLKTGNNTLNYGDTNETTIRGDGGLSGDNREPSRKAIEAIREYARSVRSYDSRGRGARSHEESIQTYRSEGGDQAASRLTEDFLQVIDSTNILQEEFGFGAALSRYSNAMWELSPREGFRGLGDILDKAELPTRHSDTLRELSEALPENVLYLSNPVDFIDHNFGAITYDSNNRWNLSLNIERLKDIDRDVIGHEIYGHLHLGYNFKSEQNKIIKEVGELSKEDIKEIYRETLIHEVDPDKAIYGYFGIATSQVSKGVQEIISSEGFVNLSYEDLMSAFNDIGYIRENRYKPQSIDMALTEFTQIKSKLLSKLREKHGNEKLSGRLESFLTGDSSYFSNEIYARIIQLANEQGHDEILKKYSSIPSESTIGNQMRKLSEDKANYFEGSIPHNVREVLFQSDEPRKTGGSLRSVDLEDGVVIDTGRAFEDQPVFEVTTDSLIGQDRTGFGELTEETVGNYQKMMQRGEDIDPILVQVDDGRLFVEDGKNRLEAARREGREFIDAIDYTGRGGSIPGVGNMFGGVAGVEQDENGNWSIDPTKMALGAAFAGSIGRGKNLFSNGGNPIKYLDDILSRHPNYARVEWEEAIRPLRFSEAGQRYMTESGDWAGYESTFPDWVPENLRDGDLFKRVADLIERKEMPQSNASRQKELIDIFAKRIDEKLEITNKNPQIEDLQSNPVDVDAASNEWKENAHLLSGKSPSQSVLADARGELSETQRISNPPVEQNLTREVGLRAGEDLENIQDSSYRDDPTKKIESKDEALQQFMAFDLDNVYQEYVPDFTAKLESTKFNLENYEDISGWKGNIRDMYRNTERVVGDDWPMVKELLFDPLDASKGRYVEEQKIRLNELDENVVSKFGIKKKSDESRAIMNYGEGITSRKEIIDEFGAERAQDIFEAERWFRAKYDELLDQVNKVLKQTYPTNPEKWIPKRKNYFRHFQEIGDGFTDVQQLFDTPAQIDPRLEGVSAFTTPRSKWLSFAQRRSGKMTSDRDAVGGFLNYVQPFAFTKHMTPHIGRFRKFANKLAERTSPDAMGETPDLNNYIRSMQYYANDLAGKTNPADRWVQEIIPGGRVTFRALNWANKRIKFNTILGNVSSAIAQAFNVPQGIGSAGPTNSVYGAARTIGQNFSDNHPMLRSDFINERYSDRIYNQFSVGMLENSRDFAGWMISVLDEAGTKFIWNAHYEQALELGVKNPIKYADDKARNMVGGRGVGEVPMIQKSKLFQAVAPFQLEVQNLWHVMGDFVNKRQFAAIATTFVSLFLMNKVAEEIRGSGVALDPINASWEAWKLFESDPNKGRGVVSAGGRLAGEVLSNVVLGQTFAAAYPRYGMEIGGMQLPTRENFFGDEDPTRFGSGILAIKGLQDPLFKLLPPFGGTQVSKTLSGAEALRNGDVVRSDGQLMFTVDGDAESYVKNLLFGPYSTDEAREYFDQDQEERILELEMEALYLENQEMINNDQMEQARANVEALRPQAWEAYKKVKQDQERELREERIETMLPVVRQTKAMVRNDNREAAEKILNDMTDEEFQAYEEATQRYERNDFTWEQKDEGRGIIRTIGTYAKAIGTDPITAFEHLFDGETIRRTDNGTIIVHRMDIDESQQIRADLGAYSTTTEVELDHKIPLQLGGSNSMENLELVPVDEHKEYTKVGNNLGRRLREGDLSKYEVQNLMTLFRKGLISDRDVYDFEAGDEIQNLTR